MRENHDLETHLKRIRDFTRTLNKISMINSKGRYNVFISICIAFFFSMHLVVFFLFFFFAMLFQLIESAARTTQ
jgi:hypothetical protein